MTATQSAKATTTTPIIADTGATDTAAVALNARSEAAATTPEKATEPGMTRRYRWQLGDCLANYGNSAKAWKELSSTDEFTAAFKAIVDNVTLTNDARATQVEEFLLDQATVAGVLDVSSSKRQYTNPNKWDKHLAPWFSEQCQVTRRSFRKAK